MFSTPTIRLEQRAGQGDEGEGEDDGERRGQRGEEALYICLFDTELHEKDYIHVFKIT